MVLLGEGSHQPALRTIRRNRTMVEECPRVELQRGELLDRRAHPILLVERGHVPTVNGVLQHCASDSRDDISDVL